MRAGVVLVIASVRAVVDKLFAAYTIRAAGETVRFPVSVCETVAISITSVVIKIRIVGVVVMTLNRTAMYITYYTFVISAPYMRRMMGWDKWLTGTTGYMVY
jgi:hypothetical protein